MWQEAEEEGLAGCAFVPVSRLVRQVTLELIPALRAVPEAVQLADLGTASHYRRAGRLLRLQFSVDVTVAYV